MTFARAIPLLLVLAALGGCALQSSWHWEKQGGSAADLDRDTVFCKQKTYSGTDGMVTNSSVRRMHNCLESRGWQKAENR